jgi:hypothetical protein
MAGDFNDDFNDDFTIAEVASLTFLAIDGITLLDTTPTVTVLDTTPVIDRLDD